jgi:pimeloyl-ACP methyl ester carboxylesterase
MTRYVLIPGAGGVAWYWHRVVPLLERAGHKPIAVDLPGDDERAGLPIYTQRVLEALDGSTDTILVAQSLGGFTAAMVCARARIGGLVFVNAMIPKPGERVGDWGDATGSTQARIAAAKRHGYTEEWDEPTYFFHDVPADVIAEGERHERPQSERVFDDVCDFTAWPSIPIRSLIGSGDRLFPVEFQRGLARARLGIEAEVIPGGHLVALSRPRELVDALLR